MADWLHGNTEMVQLLREHDWAATSLGALESWPQSLRTAVSLMLASAQPTYVAWGTELISLYNDGYIPFAGAKHPSALGLPYRLMWPEIWDEFRPIAEAVLAGESRHFVDQPVALAGRVGRPMSWFTFSWTPLRDETGAVAGFYCSATETTDRVLAERAVGLNYRTLFDSMDQGYLLADVVFDEAGRAVDIEYVEANPAATRMVGVDLTGRRLRDVSPDYEEYWYEIWGRVARTGIGERLERYAAPEGLWYSFYVFKPEANNAASNRIAVLFQDVSEQKRAAEALRESEERYRTLFEAVDAGFCVMEMEFDDELRCVNYRYAEVNPAFAAQTGVENAAGKWIKDLVPDLEQHWFDIYGRVALTGEPERFEAPADPVGRWYDVHAFRIGKPEQRRVAILFNDITARREAEIALRELNETLEDQVAARSAALLLHQNIVQSNPGPILAFDRELRVTAFNKPHADKFFETQGAPSYIGQRFPDYFIPEERPQITALMERALAGETFTTRVHFGDPAHTKLFWDLTHGPVRNAEGAIVGGFHHAIEVTAQVAAERALVESQEALRHAQKMDAMGQLTGGVAHDFNNLLTPILGSLDLLQRQGLGGEREQRLIGGALQSAERAKTLVQRLLAFARRQPLQLVAVDPTRLVKGMKDLIASTLGPQIKFSISAPEGLPAARADINQIEMALLNLSVNARDAMPEGGHLQIVASEEVVGSGHRSNLPDGPYIRFAVIDNGVGMDEQTAARAVEPFFSTKGVGQGTGLGLSMALGVAQQLNGALTLRSIVGEGTEVELWLPLSDAPAAPEKTVDTLDQVSRMVGTLLLIDDEELVRMSTAEMLTDLGYAVVEVSSAREALQQLDGGLRATLIISDHLMPGMTGTELAAQLREQGDTTPVLIVSGYAESRGVSTDLPRLVKPFRQPELIAMIADIARSA